MTGTLVWSGTCPSPSQQSLDERQLFEGTRDSRAQGGTTVLTSLLGCCFRNFRLADCVTLGNGFCGALSLFSSARYLLTSDQTYLWSVSRIRWEGQVVLELTRVVLQARSRLPSRGHVL